MARNTLKWQNIPKHTITSNKSSFVYTFFVLYDRGKKKKPWCFNFALFLMMRVYLTKPDLRDSGWNENSHEAWAIY